jgi:hypothetical protein
MAEAVYMPEDELLVPTELARGPWDAEAQHGGAPAALIGWALERENDDPAQQFTRVSLDLLRPVPLRPLAVTVSKTGGRAVGRWEATLQSEGKTLVRARALSCATKAVGGASTRACARLAFPREDDRLRIPGMLEYRSFHYTAMRGRLAEGSISTPGPASVWFCLSCPLIAGEPPAPLSRVLAAADFGSGISWELSFERYAYLNADLSVHLHRLPRGEWIGVAAQMSVGSRGVGLAQSALFDREGQLGTALQTLVVLDRENDGAPRSTGHEQGQKAARHVGAER